MTEHLDDGHELLTPREQAEMYLLHAEHAQSQEGMQTFYLAAIAHLLRSIDDKLTLPEPDTMHADGYGAIRVFHATDEVIDFLLNDQEPHERRD
jgi:hypothetical protein